jgi:Flp pilus assembly pilin Flp
VKNLIKKLVREERGQDLVEYAFLVSGIGIAAYAGVTLLGTALTGYYTNLSTSAPLVATPAP